MSQFPVEKWNFSDDERTNKLIATGADLKVLHKVQKAVTPDAAEKVADSLTTGQQKKKVFKGIHHIAAASSSSFVFETLVEMYLMSYKLNEDQTRANASLRREAGLLRAQLATLRCQVNDLEGDTETIYCR
ncbi:hypothetical protein SGCOL_006438 [Colletotrichum sp. CLE4]